MARPLPLSLAAAAIIAGCTRGSAPSGADLHRLRNKGKLEASRDTPEGYAAAADAFRALLRGRFDPGDQLNLARALALGGMHAEAMEALERARAALPAGAEAPADVPYLEGLAAMGLARYGDAAARFAEVTRRDPALVAGWYLLGTCLSHEKRHAEAAAALEKAAALDPGHLPAHYKLSQVHRFLGDEKRAEEWLGRFEALKASSGEPESDAAAYQRSRYTAITLVPPPQAASEPPPAPLRFEDATAAAGLEGQDAASIAPFDADGDGDQDLYLVRRGPNRLLRNDGGRFADVTDLSDADDAGSGVAARAADLQNDSLADLFVINSPGPSVLLKGLGKGVFQPVPGAGLSLEGVLDARWVDHDHDGDLDLAALQEEGGAPALSAHRNNGDETFAAEAGLFPGAAAAGAGPGAIAAADLDRGNDIDIVLAGGAGPAAVFMNLRKGPFRGAPVEGLSGHPGIAAADLTGDGEPDLVGAPGWNTPLRVAASQGPAGPGRPPRFSVRDIAGAPGGPAASLAAADIDNDGDLDVLYAGGSSGPVLLANRRGGDLERADLPGIAGPMEAKHVSVLDADGDGRLDLLVLGSGGRLSLWRQGADLPHGAVSLRLVGGRDNRDGVGSHVELFAGGSYQRRLAESSEVRFGIGSLGADAIDGFEVTWPNGVAQPVTGEDLRWKEGRRIEVVQKRGLTVSCPFLYVHDGEGYRFLTDVVGIAPLDEWLPPGAAAHLDPEEFVRIPGGLLRPSGGRLRAAVTEELKETAYLDRLALIRIDHPRGTVVLADESTRQGGIEPLRVLVFRAEDIHPPRRAVHDGARDGLDEVARADRRYLHAYRDAPSQWAGWSPPSALEIVPPEGWDAPGGGRALLLTGRIYWPDSTVSFALAQHGRRWDPPRLEAVLAGGGAAALVPDIGFPSGMDRTMAVPLPDALPAGAASLRLVASHRFLWDRIAFARSGALVEIGGGGDFEADLPGGAARLSAAALPLQAAELAHHGFSPEVGDLERHEQVYDFARARPHLRFPLPSGNATRRGDVLPLLAHPDSMVVVLPPGDGVRVEFAAGPPPGPGSESTYFLLVTGWAKENNFHNPTGRRIAPLPFHGIAGYPPASGGPRGTPSYDAYLEEYQTRRVGE
jgi:hypothetical protein